jgi:hypothetical protein
MAALEARLAEREKKENAEDYIKKLKHEHLL